MVLKGKVHINKVAIIGAGKFGTTVANMIAPTTEHVFLYTYKPSYVEQVKKTGLSAGQFLLPNIEITDDLPRVLGACTVVLPIIPAVKLRAALQSMKPYICKNHMLLHGIKGLDVTKSEKGQACKDYHISTMSQVIEQELELEGVGCFSGPNLSEDLAHKQPAAVVVASKLPEVVEVGCRLLSTDSLCVFQSSDLLGVELCGVLKNIFAIASGLLHGLGYGHSTYGFFLNMAVLEMRSILEKLGANVDTLLTPAGLGDLIATCGSPTSRNYTVGYRLAQGESLQDILSGMHEVAEGVRTTKVVHQILSTKGCHMPLVEAMEQCLYHGLPARQAMQGLMSSMPCR